MECSLCTRGRLFFPFFIGKLCAKAGVVATEEEEKFKVKPAIDLALIKKLPANLEQKKSRTSGSKSAQSPTEATLTSTRRCTLRLDDIFSPLKPEKI